MGRMSSGIEKRLERCGRVCPAQLAFFLDNSLRRLLHRPQRLLAPFVRPGFVAADIGCGPGFFTLPMARLVGESGRVLALDLQPGMLAKLARKARRAGLTKRIRLGQSRENDLGMDEPVDFALAFWMAHEVADLPGFFSQIAARLKPGAFFLLVEPKMHVTEELFKEIVQIASGAGLKPFAAVKIRWSRSLLFQKP